MEVEPTEPSQPSKRTTRKRTGRGTRRRKAKRSGPASANGGAATVEAEPPQDRPEVAADGPPVANASGESPLEVSGRTAKTSSAAKVSRRGGRKRGGRRKTPARDEGTGKKVPDATAADTTTPDASKAPAESPAAPRTKRQSRRRKTTRIKKKRSAPDRPPAATHDAKGRTPEAEDRPPAAQTAEAARPADAPAKRKRRKRGGKARKASLAADTSAPPVKEPPAPEKPPEKPRETPSEKPRTTRPVPATSVGGAQAAVRQKDRPPQTGREMIINVSAGEECRVAILHEGRLEELHLERQSAESHVGNIYKGRVTNVEPSIQAAFIDFGLAKNGFLHISDVQPKYFPDGRNEPENVGKKVPRRDRPPIHKCFRRGQEVIVQITKEGVGTKGPTLTTYLSIPGRYLVMMPGMSRLGVSRKIEDEDARHHMRAILNELSLPDGMGFILRTAGLNRTKRDLQRDLNYLRRLWKIVEDRIHQVRAPVELYQESDLVIRTIRDLYTPEFDRIVIDHEPTAQKAREFIHVAMPRSRKVIELYEGRGPIFHKYGIEAEIERINSRHVPLSSGGSIVIESTEAMVTIDVNSGKFRALDDAEESAFQINLEAAEEIARQLRLRDLGGLVVCDFIDMRLDRHKRAVERALRDALKKHKERARILRMSQFGLIEMTRQRQRPSIRRSIYADCAHCRGTGVVKTLETMVLEVIRVLQLATHQPDVATATLSVSPDVSVAVLNQRRAVLHQLEQETGTSIVIRSDPAFGIDRLAEEFRDSRGRVISVDLS